MSTLSGTVQQDHVSDPPWPLNMDGEKLEVTEDVLWVGSSTSVYTLGSQVYYQLKLYQKSTLRAIGAGAVNQAVKGIVKARQLYSAHGEDVITKMGMITVPNAKDEPIAAVVFHCLLS